MTSVHRDAIRPEPPRGTYRSRFRQLRTDLMKAPSHVAIRRALIARQLSSNSPSGGPVTVKNAQQPDQPGRRRFSRYLRALVAHLRTQSQSTDPSLKTSLLRYLRDKLRDRIEKELLEQFTNENSALMVLLQSLVS
ncbi:hypothetical protein [Streptomyces sp. NPDC055632]